MAMREAGHDYNCVKWLHAKSVNCCFNNNICALFVTGVISRRRHKLNCWFAVVTRQLPRLHTCLYHNFCCIKMYIGSQILHFIWRRERILLLSHL